MITSRRPPRTRALLALALVLSVLVHLFGGVFFTKFNQVIARVMGKPESDRVDSRMANVDPIEIERRQLPPPAAHPPVHLTAPKPHPIAPPIPKLPRPVALQQHPQPTVVHARSVPSSRPELAHITVHAPAQVAKSQGAGSPETAQSSRKGTLSSEQINQLESKFAKTIADAHTDVATITSQTQEQIAAPKHYGMQFNGIHSDLRHGEGYIRPIAPGRRVGNYVYYFTHYEYMYADGHVEQDDIPWEFVYTLREDPFAHGFFGQKIPLQAPPPGFKPTRQLAPILMQFFGGPQIQG